MVRTVEFGREKSEGVGWRKEEEGEYGDYRYKLLI